LLVRFAWGGYVSDELDRLGVGLSAVDVEIAGTRAIYDAAGKLYRDAGAE
jgi:hypothetical protein